MERGDGMLAFVDELPPCDFGCGREAKYDFMTKTGAWAYGCATHYIENRAYRETGTGKGQRLELKK